MPATAAPTPPGSPGRLRRLWEDTGPQAALTVLAVCVATGWACVHLHREADAADAARHRLLHREVAEEALARVDAQRHALLGLAGLFAADGGVSRDAFERAVAAVRPAENYPAARAFGYLRRVGRAEEQAFVAAVRDAGDPHFGLHGPPTPAPAGDRLVVTYRSPPAEERPVLGLDVGAEADRRETLERAAATGQMALSAPLTYSLGADDGVGLLAALPVEASAGGAGLRRETGWVYAALVAGELFAGLGGGPGAELAASLSAAGGPGGGPTTLLGDPVGPDAAGVASPLLVGGQPWTLRTRPGPGFERASRFGAWLVKAAGLAAAALAFLLFRVPAVQRRRGRREGRREARRLAAEMTRELREAAETDALTGLANRAAILGHIERAGERSRRRLGVHHAVLFLDFDRFKEVNDTRGHAAGDELLRRIGKRIQAELRGGDDAARGRRRRGGRAGGRGPGGGRGAVPARLGGDEFVVLLRGLAGPADARAVAERLLDRLAEPHLLSSGGPPVRSTPSIGVAVGGPGLGDGASLLAAADAAMYAAKRAGRACVRVHGEDAPAPADTLRLAA